MKIPGFSVDGNEAMQLLRDLVHNTGRIASELARANQNRASAPREIVDKTFGGTTVKVLQDTERPQVGTRRFV